MQKEKIEDIKKKKIEEIKKNLLSVSNEDYPNGKHQDHILELFKLYIDMTQKISQRRASANTWFLTINTALMAVIGVCLSKEFYPIIFTLVSFVGVTGCYLWRRLIISYQQMNWGRFAVIHEIEEMLPLRIAKAEWDVLGQGKIPELYKPFTDVEKKVPTIFSFLYLGVIVLYWIIKLLTVLGCKP